MVGQIGNSSPSSTVSKTLFETLPYPAYQTDDIDLKQLSLWTFKTSILWWRNECFTDSISAHAVCKHPDSEYEPKPLLIQILQQAQVLKVIDELEEKFECHFKKIWWNL